MAAWRQSMNQVMKNVFVDQPLALPGSAKKMFFLGFIERKYFLTNLNRENHPVDS